jgi:hypothetical protein
MCSGQEYNEDNIVHKESSDDDNSEDDYDGDDDYDDDDDDYDDDDCGDIEMTADEENEEGKLHSCVLVRCPLFKSFPAKCVWFDSLGKLENHVRDSHADILTNGPNFVCKSLKDNVLLILFDAEIFLYHKYFNRNGMCYAAVQQVGITNKKYKYTIKLLSVENTMGRIVISFLMDNVSTRFRRIFEDGRCMALEKNVLKPFIKNDKINMIVNIKEVPLSQFEEQDSSASCSKNVNV